MGIARRFVAASACVVLGSAVAACSGSFGSGTNGPVPLASLVPEAIASSSATPSSSSVVLTYGTSTAFQDLPAVSGYSGAIAFPKAPAPTPLPKSSAIPTAEPIAIGATLSVVKPEDGPDLNFVSGKGKSRKTRELPARALAYVTLLPTHDVELPSYPRVVLNIPRELAAQYRDGEFGLALWNSGAHETAYRLAVAERDTASPPPLAASSAALATPKPSPSAAPTSSASAAPTPSATPSLPPERILFAGTAASLSLVANRPAIFALYALPHATATPAPIASPTR